MFGGAEAVKQDLEAMKARKFFDDLPPNYAGMTPGMKSKLGELIRSKGHTLDMSVPTGYFEHLQKQVLLNNGLARINDFGEFRLTPEGLNIGEACAKANLPAVYQPKLPATVPALLQTWVRDARADLQTMMNFKPFFMDKWWWRSTLWNLRKWWAGTNPEPKPFIPPQPVQLWSEEDELRNGRMWMESKFKAFWLCPTGVEKGLQHLDTLDKLKKKHGKNCLDAAAAVGEFAKLCALLPPVTPLTPIEHIQKHMFDKGGDFNVQEVTDKNGSVTRIAWQGEPGHGKSYTVGAGGGTTPFIRVHDNIIEATEDAKKLADIQGGRDFDETTKKHRPKKPRQFVLIDQFDKAFAQMEDQKNKVPYRVGIPIENPCYLHAHECDCKVPARKAAKPGDPRPVKK